MIGLLGDGITSCFSFGYTGFYKPFLPTLIYQGEVRGMIIYQILVIQTYKETFRMRTTISSRVRKLIVCPSSVLEYVCIFLAIVWWLIDPNAYNLERTFDVLIRASFKKLCKECYPRQSILRVPLVDLLSVTPKLNVDILLKFVLSCKDCRTVTSVR